MEGDEVSHLDPQDGPWSISVLNCFDMCRCSCGCSSPARCVHQQKCSDSFTWVRGVLMRGWRAWSGQGRMWALTSTLASSLGTTPLASHGSSPMRTGFGGPPKSSPMRTGDCPALFAEGYTSPPHRERERERVSVSGRASIRGQVTIGRAQKSLGLGGARCFVAGRAGEHTIRAGPGNGGRGAVDGRGRCLVCFFPWRVARKVLEK